MFSSPIAHVQDRYDDALKNVPDEHRTIVSFEASFLLNTTPGERPSGALYTAVDHYNRRVFYSEAAKKGAEDAGLI